MPRTYLAPSILSADLSDIQGLARRLETWGVDYIHLDVMDGVFVPNFTFGISIVAAFRKATTLPLDVHLMMVHPERYIDQFVAAGADILTVHYEASPHLHRTLQAIRTAGARAGVALNPHTPVEVLIDVLEAVDLVLVMSVNPGFGGQQFIERTFEKVRRLRRMCAEAGVSPMIAVDGGVSPANAASLIASGADFLVAGNAILRAENPEAVVQQFRAVM